MERALLNYTIIGVKTNISFLLKLLKCPEYFEGAYNTQFVERTFMPRLEKEKNEISDELKKALAIGSIIMKEKHESASSVSTGGNNKHKTKGGWLKRKELY